MEEKTEEVLALSDDGEAVECDDGTVSPTPVTVPKKRGRPANSEKPKKAPSSSGRGRGRPAKGSDAGGNKKPVKAVMSADGSEEEGSGSDGDSPLLNGDAAEAPTAVGAKRGRKPKAKRKINHIVESTGKGRGRPKKMQKADDGDDEEAADDNGDVASNDKPVKKVAAKGAKKGRGRPKKVQSDDESSDNKQDDYEEKRSVGRPPSGGTNLNIVRTGRGQGRPKKKVAEKRASETENGDEEPPKQRGRPATTGKEVNSPTGKPRGRPKSDLEEKDDDEKDDAEVAEDSADVDKDDDDKANSESEGEDI